MMEEGETSSDLRNCHFWDSQVELVRKKTLAPDGKKFRYFDDKGVFNFVFMIWIYRWVKTTAKTYLDPYMLHPLPLADQILIWQPILSRHISDGIASIEAYESLREDEKVRAEKPVRHILLRALLLTLWKRIILLISLILLFNAIGMSVAVMLHKLLNSLSGKEFKFMAFLGLAISIILIELFKDIGMSHIEYYVRRLSFIVDPCLRVTIFQHGLCYRRNVFKNVESIDGSCKSIIHSCSGKSACADNPLLCPARRYKNSEVTPKMYALILTDSYYLPFFMEALPGFINFLVSLIYGIILMISQFNMKVSTILLVSLSLVICMIVIEATNGFLMKYYLGVRDHRIAKSSEIVSGLTLTERMALDDIGHDIITETRNDELTMVFVRFLLALMNKAIMASIMCANIIILINDFMGQVEDANDVKEINPSGLLASIFVLMKIIGPLYMVPMYLRLMLFGINALLRVESFFRTCSPNFYLPDNRFTGKLSLPEALPDKDSSIPKGLLVMFKNASFAWVNSRRELMDKTGITCLENINFVLNTGNLAIITGSQGSGKSNFVKAILGDMTLVDGSMAVLPLSTNMPIFYAPQDVWLQKGTIRSNITFGHKFDEDLYRMVIKAVELEHDISTWKGGDMRKISEHGYSLSGGQRVRIGLARAIYSYLIYSKINKEENDSKCSFLVVIDDLFTGLDPFVAKTIFRNLFDKKRGLLSGYDVSVVLTISKRILEECVSSESSSSFFDATIYSLRNKTLVRSGNLKSLIDNEAAHLESPKPSVDRVKLQHGSHSIIKRCSSGDFTREGRRVLTELKYSESPTVQSVYDSINLKGANNKDFRPYGIYFRAAGWPILFFFIFTIIFATLDSTKFVITSKISDSIVDYTKNCVGAAHSLEDVKDYCFKSMRWIVILSVSVIVGAFVRVVAMTSASFNVSRRIHEYCINSLFVNSSTVLDIKRSLSSIQTFLYMDTFSIDNMLNYYLHDVCLLLIETGVQMITLFSITPWAVPLSMVLVFIILRFIIYYYVKACKNIAFSRLESYNQIDAAIESAISGLPTCRSFKKEWELMHDLTEHVDYNIRGTHLNNAVMFWSCITFRCLFSPLALFLLVFPLIRSRYFDVGIKVGYYAMAYSLFMAVNNYFANFLELLYLLQLHLLPMRRFENFVPSNTPIEFGKGRNIHQTDVIFYSSEGAKTLSGVKNSIRARRNDEYNLKRPMTFTGFRMLFFRHKVNIFDVSKYTVPGHVRVQLDNVNVYVSSKTSHQKYAILKNVTCSANVSDIVGIIGRTGAGKSTLLSVLQNLARNREGSVLLDGCDLRDMPKNVTRQVIGVLPQLPFVFRGWTVRRFIDPRMLFDDFDIEMALENCGLLKFVETLPGGKGLDTIILPDHYHKDMPTYLKRVYYGPTLKPYDVPSSNSLNVDSGATLSNSQLRTLTVARLVLYREFFKVLLVDEPPEDESGTLSKTIDTPIYELIKTYFKHCVTFIAAHDASILRLCTSVWVFHNGSLIRTCKAEDIVDSGSLSKIIEGCISQHT